MAGTRFPVRRGEGEIGAADLSLSAIRLIIAGVSILLIGYRGSGKSSVARELAKMLHWAAVDTDQLIEQSAGMTIRDIFQRDGEAHFRDLESSVVRDVCAQDDCVIALGGGAVLREETRDLLKRSGHRVIYLHADPRTLFDRIHSDPQTQQTRPSLTHLGGGLEEIQHLLAQRLPLYRQVMTAEIDVAKLSPVQVAQRIQQMIGSPSH